MQTALPLRFTYVDAILVLRCHHEEESILRLDDLYSQVLAFDWPFDEAYGFFQKAFRGVAHKHSVVWKQRQLHFSLVLRFFTFDILKCVTHDRDNHIQSGHAGDKSGEREQGDDDLVPFIGAKVFQGVEFSECQQVLVEHGIQESEMEVFGDDFVTLLSLIAQNVDWSAKGCEENREDHEEGHDIGESLLNELDVKRSRVRDPHPVKHLEPDFQAYDCTHEPKKLFGEHIHTENCIGQENHVQSVLNQV